MINSLHTLSVDLNEPHVSCREQDISDGCSLSPMYNFCQLDKGCTQRSSMKSGLLKTLESPGIGKRKIQALESP